MQKPNGYSRTQVALHWLVVALIAAQYVLHDGIEAAWQARLDGTIANEPFPNPHAIIGMVIFLFSIWRLALRWRHGALPLPENEPAALKVLAGATHVGIYALLIAMPISGALAWVLGLELPASGHQIAAKVMLGLIVLHVAGAVVQRVVLKSDVMARMAPGRIFKAGMPRR